MKKPLWSRLSPAANDVNPVYTVFVNLSLLVKKIMFKFNSDVLIYGRMSIRQHRGTQKKLCH